MVNLLASSKSKTSPQRNAGTHQRIRSDHATELAEDYVEAIADVIQERGSCRAVDLAKRFGVSHVTVNKTIGRLVRDELVETQPYGPVLLTKAGQQLAKAAKTRHEIVLQFLLALGVSRRVAEVDSEGIEHHVSQETLKAMRSFLAQQSSGTN